MAPQAPPDWNTGDQIRTHKLATSIINNHANDGNMVLDNDELALLQRFASDPSSRDQILREKGWADDYSGQNPSTKKAERDQSLSGFLIAKHGSKEPALDERDIELLNGWFAKGMPTNQSVVR